MMLALIGMLTVAPAKPPVPMLRTLHQIQALYSGQRALETTRFVAQFWRVPGNTGFNASIHRVAEILAAAGYVPREKARSTDRLVYRIEHRPLGHPTWEPVGGRVTIAGDSTPLLRYETNRHLVTINSASTQPGGVEAEVVKVTAGQWPDSAAVAGRIVYALGPIGRLYPEAMKRGAVGVVAYSLPAYTRPEVNQHSIQFSGIPLDTTRAGWGVLLSYAARRRLDDALSRGPVRLRVELETKRYPSDELTLVAEVRGSQAPEERFVFSAHVQEPGANDNATGVGALAEMARVAAQLVRAGKQDPDRTITFLWGDEIRSTRRFIEEDSVRARGIKWGMSLDMVGENASKTGGTFLIEKMPDPSAVWNRGEDHHTEWGGGPVAMDQVRPHFFNDFVLRRALDQAGRQGWVVRTNPYEGGSDHIPFIMAGKPAVLLWHFTDQFYHTDGDRIENVSAAELANVGITAVYSALALTAGGDGTMITLAGELGIAAEARLTAETALSQAAIKAGGDLARERPIIEAWIAWYRGAIASVREIAVGPASAAVESAIRGASAEVEARGTAALSTIANPSR